MLALISFVCLTCDNDVTKPGDDNRSSTCKDTVENFINPLYPGNVGTTWQYKSYLDGQSGGEEAGWTYNGFTSFNINLNDNTWNEDSFKVEIKNKKFICLNDTSYESNIRISYPLSDHDTNFIYWAYWNGNNGVYSLGLYNNTDSLFHKGLYIKYPIVSGDKWNDKIVVTNGYDFQFFEFIENECISDRETINTPFGSFLCYVIFRREEPESVGGYYDHYEYYSPNIGLVCSVKKYTIPPSPGLKGFWRIESVRILEEYLIKN